MSRPVLPIARLLFTLIALVAVIAGPPPAEDPIERAYRRGMAAFERGDYEAAVRWFEQVVARAERELGPDDPRLATDLVNLAEVYRLTGRLEAAERLYRRALELDRRNPHIRPEELAITLNDLALLYRMQGRHEQAARLYREALQRLEQARGRDHPDVARVLANMAQLERALRRLPEALALARRAAAIAEARLPPDDPARRAILAGLERIRSELARAHAVPPSAADGAGGYVLQLAALGSPEAARTAARRLRARFAEALAGLPTLAPQPVDVAGKGRLWRVRFGPLADRVEAQRRCVAIRRAGGRCRVMAAGK